MPTYVHAKAFARAGAKVEQEALHRLCSGTEPAVWVEGVGIVAEDGLDTVERVGVHTNAVLRGKSASFSFVFASSFVLTQRTPAGM